MIFLSFDCIDTDCCLMSKKGKDACEVDVAIICHVSVFLRCGGSTFIVSIVDRRSSVAAAHTHRSSVQVGAPSSSPHHHLAKEER